MSGRIKAIDKTSVHRITSSQVVVDLQTAIKELVENSLDAGATVIEVRIKEYGLKLIEVIDNGTGISKDDYETVALKHHTSKLSSFEDLTTVETFGFRGEALASLCALCESVTVTTATTEEAPMGTVLQLDRTGRVTDKAGHVARQRGTTVSLTSLFTPLPVRRKEFERHAKREYGKALNLLTAYALVPCTSGTGVKLTVSHVSESGKKLVQIQTDGSTLLKNSITTLWGSKGLENLTPINLKFQVEPDSALFRRRGLSERQITVKITGMVSRFAVGCGRASNDRQFFFVNQRPCNLSKIQKAMNEVYKTFNQTQSPFLVLDFSLPTDVCDINVSPDKRTIFVHSEEDLIEALKTALADHFDQGRSQFALNTEGQTQRSSTVPKRSSLRSADLQEETSDPPDRMVSSDPLPTTQPVPFTMPSSDPPSQGPPRSPPPTHSPRLRDIATASKNSSRLVDHMSPSPDPPSPKQVRSASGVHGRKRRIAESPSGSDDETSAREEQNTLVQTVLSTVGASWSSARLPESSKSTGSDQGGKGAPTS
ncbi:hypothetical protein FRC15_003428 [Serendipita sp. 397]|nr:hypothetical protein FRC15_003428 [Serendipita sp. 397]